MLSINGNRIKDDDIAGQHSMMGSIFGDAVFETMLVYRGRIHLLDLHLQRLLRGAAVLGLECDISTIKDELAEYLQYLNTEPECHRIRLVLQREQSAAGYSVKNLATQRSISSAVAELPGHGRLNATKSPIILSSQPSLAGIKHANRLEQVLARQKLDNTAYDEAVMLDADGRVVECIASNIYILEGDRVFTPDLNKAGVEGVARHWLIENAERFGLYCSELDVGLSQLIQADAVFASNAIAGFRQIASYTDGQNDKVWELHPTVTEIQKKFIQSVKA